MRIVRTDLFPTAPEKIEPGLKVITPHVNAAKELDVAHVTLERLARETLKRNGLNVLPKLRSRYLLKKVIRNVMSDTDASAYADRINEALTTILRTGIDAEDLLRYGSPRVVDLAKIVIYYKAELTNISAVDDEEVLIRAASGEPDTGPLLIWGHFRARHEEIAFIDAAAGDGSILYLPCGDDPIYQTNRYWAERLEMRGWTLQRSGEADGRRAGWKLAKRFLGTGNDASAAALRFNDIDSEVRGILARCKRLVAGGVSVNDIAVVSRKPENYAPAFAAVAAEYGIPVQIHRHIPTLNTSFGELVRLLLETIENGMPFEETLRLLMHRFGPGISSDILEAARREHYTGAEKWASAGIDVSIFETPPERTIKGWLEYLTAIFEHFRVIERLAADGAELNAHNAFLAELRTLSMIERQRTFNFSQFRAICLEALFEATVPFSTARSGVELIGPESIFGSTYGHLFIIGLAEGEFPAHAVDNPVVDFYERKQLAQHGIEFEMADEVGRWESLAFCLAMLAGKESITLSYAGMAGKAELLPSPFFDRLGLEPAQASQIAAASIEEHRAALLASATHAGADAIMTDARRRFRVETSRLTSTEYDEYDGIAGRPINACDRSWSVSQFTKFGQCSFRWFAERLLQVAEPDELEPALDYAHRGSFYHRVIELATLRALDSPDQRAAIKDALEEAFREAEADPEVKLPAYTNWEIQAGEHLKNLQRAVSADDFLPEGSTIVAAEKEFNTTWMGLRIQGTIDRVDRTSDGMVAIDYKTRTAMPDGAKDDDGKLKLDVQIPVYAEVALRALYPKDKVGKSKYYSLIKAKALAQGQGHGIDRVEKLVEMLKKRLSDGAFPVDPDSGHQACRNCKFDPVCRKSHRLEAKSWQD